MDARYGNKIELHQAEPGEREHDIVALLISSPSSRQAGDERRIDPRGSREGCFKPLARPTWVKACPRCIRSVYPHWEGTLTHDIRVWQCSCGWTVEEVAFTVPNTPLPPGVRPLPR